MSICLTDLIAKNKIFDLESSDKKSVLTELSHLIAKDSPEIEDEDEFVRAILEREKILSTGIGQGIAVPHAKLSSIKAFSIGLARCKDGIEFDAIDDRPVYLIFMIAGPDNAQRTYLRILAKISLIARNKELMQAILDAKNNDEILNLLRNK